MIIQHNIPAMNAYRNYTNNTSALQSNLEKLSSGYRINKAGDDAAGLAISEKMRAQITGLQVAQKNAKDGISLVQTAEGAMTEVHDMLNRMYELAEQSANGTYSDDVDREQLQKEIESLTDEIDRIADSTNFNGIKLLDGTMSSTGTAAVRESSNFEIGGSGDGALPAVDDTKINDGGTVLHKAGTPGSTTTTFGIDFHNAQITGDKDDTFTIDINGTTLTGTLLKDAGAGAELDAEDIVNALTGDDTSLISFDIGGTPIDPTSISIGNATYEVSKNGSTGVTFTLNGGDAPTDVAFDITLTVGTDSTTPTGIAPTVTTANGADSTAAGFTDGTAATNSVSVSSGDMSGSSASSTLLNAIKAETSVSVGDMTVSFAGLTSTAGSNMSDVIAELQTIVDAAVTTNNSNGAAGQANYNEYSNVKVEVDGTSGFKITYTETPQTYNTATNATAGTATVDFTSSDGSTVVGSSVTVDGVTYEFVADAADVTSGNTAVVVSDTDTAADLADALVTAAATKGTNVASVALDANDSNKVIFTATATGATSTLTASPSSKTPVAVAVTGQYSWKATNQSVETAAGADTLAQTSFDLSAAMAADGAQIRIGDDTYTFTSDASNAGTSNYVYMGDLDLTNSADLATAAQRLTEAAVDNGTYSVGQQGANITLTERVDYTTGSQTYDLSTEDGIEASLGFSSVKSAAVAGKPLTLQIGDTSDSYNKMTVDVNDMHAVAMGIGDIDISTQDGASDAMAKIKDAINYVSSTRGDLGAIQNRLDHTINNLSVAEENITDAESTIRDVDIAEEMMSYTKNNILVQAAQAMLAQANQLPQGVLQLLQ